MQIITRFSTNRDFQPYDTIHEVERRNLFLVRGLRHTAPMAFTQSLDAYIESFHSRNGFSRDRMSEEMAQAFDEEVRQLVTPFLREGQVALQVTGSVTWGIPMGL